MEEGYIEDAEFTTEQCVFSIFTVQSEYMELNENLEKVSKAFNLPIEVIKRIVEIEDNQNNKYLETLDTKELDAIYLILVRNLGNNPKTDLISDIEKIIINRLS